MAKISIPVELYKGRDAIPLKKMGKIVEEIEKFLKILGEDIELESEDGGEWLATNIRGGSLGLHVGRSGVSENKAHLFMYNYEKMVSDPLGINNGHISSKTRKQFAKIADVLDPGDYISFGVPVANRKKPKWHHLSKETSLDIIKAVDRQIQYHGSIQGIIHDLQLETRPLFFKIRELSHPDRLIKCFYDDDLYDSVRKTLEKKNAIVYISGLITANQADEKIEYMKITKKEDICTAEEFQHGDIDKFVGCCPGILGKKSLQDWIDEVRERG